MNHNKALHRFSLFTAFSTFCLIIAGGLVTSTGSSLAVPDWPLAYGKVFPPMVGGILYEHSHRLIATFVGMLTIVLTVWLWRSEERRWLKALGIVALAAVISQGLLGGLTVVFLLPTAISVAHATLAQTYFSIICSIALFTSRWWQADYPKLGGGRDASLLRLSIFVTACVFVQLVLGALMRHTGSGLVVPDFPLAYGQLFPSLNPESIALYNRQLIDSDIRLFADGAITSAQIAIHMAHRFWALVVTIAVCTLAVRLVRSGQLPRRLKRLGILLVGLLSVQACLGAFTVISRKGVEITTAHVATGALILAVSVILLFQLVRVYELQPGESLILFSPKKAFA